MSLGTTRQPSPARPNSIGFGCRVRPNIIGSGQAIRPKTISSQIQQHWVWWSSQIQQYFLTKKQKYSRIFLLKSRKDNAPWFYSIIRSVNNLCLQCGLQYKKFMYTILVQCFSMHFKVQYNNNNNNNNNNNVLFVTEKASKIIKINL